MPRQLSVTQMARNFAEYLNRVAYRGERFVLVRGGMPIAELGPIPSGRSLGELRDILESIPRLDPEDAVAFSEDLAAARTSLAEQEIREPWPS
jgi:antitoxin (DNA-binding transcriptional repressor) of toxin-antitoxin stability system